MNNTNRVHDVVDLLTKISADKNIVFDVATAQKLAEAGLAVNGKQVNGVITKDGIVLNLESSAVLETTVGHEITHALEGTEHYEVLKEAIREYAELKGVYQSKYSSLESIYSKKDAKGNILKDANGNTVWIRDDVDIDSEIIADLVGEYLFTDADFINNLSVKHRNVFQKIYDEIKYLCKIATAGSEEARKLEEVKRAFDKAYKEDTQLSENIKLSIIGNTKDGRRCYKSDFGSNVSRDERIKVFKERIATIFNLGAVELKTDVKKIRIRGDKFTAQKNLYGDRKGQVSEQEAKIDSLYDLADILATAKYDPSATTKEASYANPAQKPKNKAHDGVKYWYKFRNEIVFDGVPYTVTFNIRDKGGEQYQYLIDFKENKTPGLSNTAVNSLLRADQVSYEDNIAPVPKNVNGKFSLSEAVEETKDLVAVHNLQSSELLRTINLGGLPMPSIAVIKAQQGHEQYGDVSLIFPKESIDPKAKKENKVYGGDAWTPTYPRIEYKPNEAVSKRIRDKYYELAEKIGYDAVRPLYRYVSELESALNGDGGEAGLLDRLYEDDKMMQVYLEDSGKGKVEPIVKETRTEATEAEKEMNQWFIDRLGEDVIRAFKAPAGVSPFSHRQEFMAQYGELAENAYRDLLVEKYDFSREDVEGVLDNTDRKDILRFIKNAEMYLRNGGVTVKTETDYEATTNAIKAKAEDGYKEWIDNLFKGVEKKSGIRNNVDYYTSSGNSRSWDALHWENTLENVVKVMKAQDQTGADAFAPSSALFAVANKQYGSIADIKADSARLGKVTEAEYEALKEEYSNRLAKIADSIKDPGERNPFIATDRAAEEIVDAVRTQKTKPGMLRYMQKWNDRVTESTVDDIVSLVSDIANMPTGYFEAKPQRAVGLDEVGVFVIPNNVDAELKQELLGRGYSIAEYDPDVEGDRNRVVNQYEEYKFSLSDPNDIAPVDFQKSARYLMVDKSKAQDFGDIAPMTEAEANALQSEKTKMANAEPPVEEEPKKLTRSELHKQIIGKFKHTFQAGGLDFDEVLRKAKNLSTFATVDNTPQRVMEKALGYKEGQILSDLTVNKVAQNETEGIKWLNSVTGRKNGMLAQLSDQYKIKPGSKESAAAQMYAEGFYVDDNNDIIAYGDAELAKDFPDAQVQNRIKGLARDPRIRQFYDETLAMINQSRTRNAYPEIPRLENYFLHFRAMDDTFSKLGLPFNPNDIRAKDLPTDLNGVTADLKPGQPYFASAMHRNGKRTSFDLLGGLERYASSAKNQIYHIDDIQNLRALRNYIADNFGQAHGLENIDTMSEEEAQQRIEEVFSSHLSTFAKFLNEEANALAGKTSLIDRSAEGIIGRRMFTFMDTLNKQVGSNMVGWNVSSALTNFDAVVRGFAKTNKFDFLKAFTQYTSNKIGSAFGKGDGFAENNPTIIRRNGADRFYRTPWQKVGDAGYGLMGVVDNISTELIVRAKYNELTRKGMSEQQAVIETDKWVSRLMGDRSLGQQPLLFNSKTLGLITKFQLEVRNNLDSMFYDTIQDAKVSNEDIVNAKARNAKTAAKITSTLVQAAVATHLFGKAFEAVAGYNPSFDILSVLATLFGFDDEEESEDTALDNMEQAFLELLEDLPYTSTLTGGRIPIGSALPLKELITGTDQYGSEKSRWETITETAPYYLLPGGFGQIKKTAQGWNMFSEDHPIAGSYTKTGAFEDGYQFGDITKTALGISTKGGKLRFPVEDTPHSKVQPINKVQAALFGQYASKNARDYFDNNRKALDEKRIQEFIDVDIPIRDYWEYREGLSEQKTIEDKFDYIAGLDLPVSKKNILINNIVDREEAVDLEGYEDFSNYEEFDFATKNPEKYTVAKAVGGYNSYTTHYKAMNDISADKDASGKSITGSRKEKIIDYVNSLDLDYGMKIILFKSEYKADDTYNADILDYLNSRNDLTYEEIVTILTELDFTVDGNGNVYWD